MPMTSIFARQIYDSSGFPTVEVDVITDLGLFRASVPSGTNTNVYEAKELRDAEPKNYHGKGVLKAVRNVNTFIAPELLGSGYEVTQQKAIDDLMIQLDGTENKSRLGVNAILAVSIAVCRAGAAKRGVPVYRHIADLARNKQIILPVPAFTVMNGGVFSSSKLTMQEIMIMPTGATSFAEAMKMGSEVYHYIRNTIKEKYKMDTIVDEGGFVAPIPNNDEALKIINDAISKSGYAGRLEIAIDASATDFFKSGKYDLDFKNKKSNKKGWLTSDKLLNTWIKFCKDFPIVSIEDPFHNEDWPAWAAITKKTNIQIVGDDLTATNHNRIQTSVDNKACNCLLLKINQIGTVTEAIQAHFHAKFNGWGTIISDRAGETDDTFIADFAVGLSNGQIKTGAPCRSEHIAKYNHLIRIEDDLGPYAKYAGRNYRAP